VLWWRCTHAFASPACLGIWCYAILAWKAAVSLIFPQHRQVSSHRSLDIVMPRKLNTPLLLFSDFHPRLLDQQLGLLFCGTRKPAVGHFGHIQGQAHVRVSKLCSTSLPCHSCRCVENLEQSSCCIYIIDSAITCTIYASVASCKVVTACLVHCGGFI